MNLKQSVVIKIPEIYLLKRTLSDKKLKHLGLSLVQWRVLAWMEILGVPCTQQELFKVLGVDPGYLARALVALEKLKLVKRKPWEEDRRVAVISPTKAGETLMKEIHEVICYEDDVITKGFSAAEKKTFKQLLDRVSNNLRGEIDNTK